MNRVQNINDHINPKISPREVYKHNTEKDCWVIIHDKVYDLTDFLKEHPGGKQAILLFAGKDATEEFDMLHPPSVLRPGKYLPNDKVLGIVSK
jgi:cytochrome b involved in lipid metabolism